MDKIFVVNIQYAWFNYFFMSSGQVKMHGSNHTQIKRVDINDLMLRVRNEKRKEKKESLVFLGLISSVLIATGLIASL